MLIRVLICGGRDFSNREFMWWELDKLASRKNISIIIHGAARGADTLAMLWAMSRKIEQLAFPANWKKYGKSAGSIRNKQMLDEGKPDLVVAFTGGVGTQHMTLLASARGIKTIVIAED